MEVFKRAGDVDRYLIRLDQGDDVLGSINQVIWENGIRDGAVVSGIGTVSHAVLHMVTTTGYPPVEKYPVWEDTALEVCAIQGMIADGVPHLHAVFSDAEKAVGGHLEPGCITLYLCEIVLEAWKSPSLTRLKNGKGINELHEKP